MKRRAYLLLFVLLLNSLWWIRPRSIYSCQCPDIYAYKLNNTWITSTCTGTSLITNQNSDLTFLATQPALPLTTPFPWSALLCGFASLALAALLGGVWRLRHVKGQNVPQ